MKKEKWVPVTGHPSYLVSDKGSIIKAKGAHCSGRVISQWKTQGGYCCVTLHSSGVRSNRTVHSLVARHFKADGYAEGLEVNHIDGDKGNNTASNLEWVTSSQNKRHAASLGLYKGRGHVPVVFTKDGVRERYPSIREASRLKGVNRACISGCLKGRQKTSAGGYWTYE